MDENTLRAGVAELVGTFAFVFISAGAVLVNELGGLQPGSVAIAFATGLAYAATLAVTLPLSGGYLNPAVTIMLWVFKRLDGGRAAVLLAMQLLGSVVAGLVLRMLFPFREGAMIHAHLGAPHLNLNAFDVVVPTLGTLAQGIGVELVLSFILVFAIFSLTIDPRAIRWTGAWASRMPALWLGILLAAEILMAYGLTGAAVNPARWFGPTVAELTVEPLRSQSPFADHAVYWVGPIAGALLAGWLYTTLILPSEEPAPAVAPAARPGASSAVTSTLFRSRK
jgi:MIP family channel proteins